MAVDIVLLPSEKMMDKAIEGGGVDEKMAEWMSTRSKRPNHGWEEDPA